MGIALSLIWKQGIKKKVIHQAVKLFLIHLGVNVGWSIVFFGLHSILAGMVVIIILWGMILELIRKFYKIDRSAAYCLIPYLAWVSFASILNFSLLLLNR